MKNELYVKRIPDGRADAGKRKQGQIDDAIERPWENIDASAWNKPLICTLNPRKV